MADYTLDGTLVLAPPRHFIRGGEQFLPLPPATLVPLSTAPSCSTCDASATGWFALDGVVQRAWCARHEGVAVLRPRPVAMDMPAPPVLPFSEIERRGAGMYRGVPRATSIVADASGVQPEEGGSTPTVALHGAAS